MWQIAQVKVFDGKEKYNMYAIISDDDPNPVFIGEMSAVDALMAALTRLKQSGPDMELDEADLGNLQAYLSLRDASTRFNLDSETLRKAAQRGAKGEASGIPGARKNGKLWKLPLLGLKQYVADRPKPGPVPSGKQIEAFYVGAAVYMDLDSEDVDYYLSLDGLTIDSDGIEACRNALKARFPEQYAMAFGK